MIIYNIQKKDLTTTSIKFKYNFWLISTRLCTLIGHHIHTLMCCLLWERNKLLTINSYCVYSDSEGNIFLSIVFKRSNVFECYDNFTMSSFWRQDNINHATGQIRSYLDLCRKPVGRVSNKCFGNLHDIVNQTTRKPIYKTHPLRINYRFIWIFVVQFNIHRLHEKLRAPQLHYSLCTQRFGEPKHAWNGWNILIYSVWSLYKDQISERLYTCVHKEATLSGTGSCHVHSFHSGKTIIPY